MRFSAPAPRPIGNWIVLKMLSAYREVNANIDIAYFGVDGYILNIKTGEILTKFETVNSGFDVVSEEDSIMVTEDGFSSFRRYFRARINDENQASNTFDDDSDDPSFLDVDDDNDDDYGDNDDNDNIYY